MKQKHIIVAIDGYSACGKSTVAKALAKKTNYLYVDSGAMYRAVALHFKNKNIDIENNIQIQDALNDISIELDFRNNRTKVTLNGTDVSERIREIDITGYVPIVSALKHVREKLTSIQRELGNNRNIIMDGRDIGSAVFPHAQVKIFMTAEPRIRAERRLRELILKTPNLTLDEVLESINNRDKEDINRKISPLIHAKDAIILDNTKLSKEEQLNFILGKIKSLKH